MGASDPRREEWGVHKRQKSEHLTLLTLGSGKVTLDGHGSLCPPVNSDLWTERSKNAAIPELGPGPGVATICMLVGCTQGQ